MLKYLKQLKTLRPWQIGVLAVLLLGTPGITVAVYFAVTGDDSSVEEGQQIVPVRTGDLVIDVAITGNLVYPERETVTFGSQAATEGSIIVGEVFAGEGQPVTQGMPLATLDPETVAKLEIDLVNALRHLRDTEEALDTSLAGPTSLQLAQARSNIADAELELHTARNALASLTIENEAALAKARAGVVDAESAVMAAADRLDDLTISREDLLDDAQGDVLTASDALIIAWDDLGAATNGQRDAMDDAETALDDAHAAYREAYNTWLGIALGYYELNSSPDELLSRWGIDLDALFDPGSRYYDLDQFVSTQGRPKDDPDTAWSEPRIYAWINLYPGTIDATCDDDAPYLGVCVQQAFEDAWDAVTSAETDLTPTKVYHYAAVAKANMAVSDAKDDVDAAKQALSDLQGERGAQDIEVARAALATMEAELAVAEAELRELDDGTPSPEPAAKQARVELAEARLDDAQAALQELLTEADPLDVAILRADVAAASVAEVAAEAALRSSTLTAPIDGFVESISVEPGDEIKATAAVLEIVDPTQVDVQGFVDEIDVLLIREGADASVTMDALAGQSIRGVVSEIGTQASGQQNFQLGPTQGLVTYPVSIRLTLPPGLSLPEGLTAVASIVLRQDNNVLLVPLNSVYGSFQEPTVRVVGQDGSIEERPVTLGNSDEFWVVVSSGVAEGERVIMQASDEQFGGFFGGIPGLGRRGGGQAIQFLGP